MLGSKIYEPNFQWTNRLLPTLSPCALDETAFVPHLQGGVGVVLGPGQSEQHIPLTSGGSAMAV